MRSLLLISTALLGLLTNFAVAETPIVILQQKELKILRVSPDGENVPVGNQIVIQFNRPVVPIGKMERDASEIPVIITPKLECQWRWLNTSALSCNLDDKNKLQESTKYTVLVKQGIKAEDGATIKEDFSHSFTTELPQIVDTWITKWLDPSTPLTRITFNQPVTKKSIEKSLYFTEELADKSKRYNVVAEHDPQDVEMTAGTNLDIDRSWLIRPIKPLPLDYAGVLNADLGLESKSGTEVGLERKAIIKFHTFPEFKFLGLKCYTNEDDKKTVFIPEKDYQSSTTQCNPLSYVSLVFNSPVLNSSAQKSIKFGLADKNLEHLAERYDYSMLWQAHQKDTIYEVTLPYGLKADATYSVKTIYEELNIFHKIWLWFLSFFTEISDSKLKDEFNRPLSNFLDITFKTNHRKPNYEIVHNYAVIESNIDSDIPLYVNNLSKTIFNYKILTAEGSKAGLTLNQDIPTVLDKQFAIPFKVREMLNGKSGVVYGRLATEPSVEKQMDYNTLFAQVTPYQVHAKIGHFNTLVWVTDMATGKPVPNALVRIYKDKIFALNNINETLSQSMTSENGIAILDGTEKIDPMFAADRNWKDEADKILIRVDKDGDIALLPIHWSFIIDSYRSVGENVYPDLKEKFGHIKTWGTTAQGIYRAGDTIQYKLYVRNQDNKTLTSAPDKGYTLQIIDPLGKSVFSADNISLDTFGSYSGEFKTSKQAAIGWYNFVLTADFANKSKDYDGDTDPLATKIKWNPIRVLVSDFTPSPFKVTNHANGDLFKANQSIELSTQANLHSGGAYTDANVRLTAQLSSKTFISKNELAKDFIFSSYSEIFDTNQVFQKLEKVDSKGENVVSFTVPEQKIYFGKLLFESAVQDERGKYVTAQSYADYAGVDRFVGLKTTDWLFQSGQVAKLDYIVVNEAGVPVADTPVIISIEKQETKAAKVKSSGNAYLPEFNNEWVTISTCNGTPKNGAEVCNFTPTDAGYYRAVAKVKDSAGKEHITEIRMYVTGAGYVLWNTSNDNSLEIIPEKSTYKIGDKARYLIKNPFPSSKALITIERYGVIDSFTQDLESSTPTIEFDIKPDYMPGFYLSVVVFSPRVEKPIENQVDLGKPTFKIGYLTVPIKDSNKEISVKVTADKEFYKPREKVKLSIHAEPKTHDKKEPMQCTIAVLDESVLDLVSGGKDYYDPYKGFYNLDGLDLKNYSLLTRLVGRQKFEKKGANPGGDGGSDLAMRSLFKFVSYWNPSVTADENGNAVVEFEAPDNLTGWRALVLSTTPTDRVGLGDANFKVNRDTEIRPALPNQIIEGDVFDASFSILNRTDKTREITVHIVATGDVDEKTYPNYLHNKISLEPFKKAIVPMQVRAKNFEKGVIKFTISAGDELDKDFTEQSINVNKKRTLETASTYGFSIGENTSESIKFPNDIYSDIGGVTVSLSPSIIGNIDGSFKYMRDYSHTCWEQRLSRSIMASHYLKLQGYVSSNFTWGDAEKTITDVLEAASNFQAPNGGMSYFIPQDQYSDPYLSAYTGLAFTWLKSAGHKIPEDVESRLISYLDNLLRNDSYPDYYSPELILTVRAISLDILASNNKISIADLERFRTQLPQMSLLGKNYFLRASLKINGAENNISETMKLILSSANQSSGKISFNEAIDVRFARILSTPTRENCAILSTFTELSKNNNYKEIVADIPATLARSIVQARKTNDHWDNTQENVFCMNALVDYSEAYENKSPNMNVSVVVDSNPIGEVKFTSVKDKQVTFNKSITPENIGKDSKAVISRNGNGTLYYSTNVSFASRAEKNTYTNSGIEINKELSVEQNGKWILLKSPYNLKSSDIVRVDLFVSVPTARNFVVVTDPIPGGLEPINRDLATSSVVDASKEVIFTTGSLSSKHNNWVEFNSSLWSFYHQEIRHDSIRFYSDYLPAGNYHLRYTAQAISSGEFTILPVYSEEMYNPEVFGKGVIEKLKVTN